MENSKTLYKSFIKLAIAFRISQGMTLEEAKKSIHQEFVNHPYSSIISIYIDKSIQTKTSLIKLLNNCVLICEEFGPNREYLTLVLLLKKLGKKKEGVNKKKEAHVVRKFEEEIIRINECIPPPPLFNRFLETRSILEWTSMLYIYPLIPKRKEGKNKPVLLIPPYLGNDLSTSFVRRYLNSLGFKAYKWDLGANMIRSSYIPILEEKLDVIYKKNKEKVSLVGWSGGGIFAKILANRHPDKVEQIITIGSPIWGVLELKTSINNFLDFFRGSSLKERNKRFLSELEKIPNVPITCIYTKTDGIVPWKHCVEASTYRKNIHNIEVFGSHSGMGANATVLLTIAHALSANIQGKEIKDVSNKFETLFFPKFWEQKGTSKIINLFFRS